MKINHERERAASELALQEVADIENQITRSDNKAIALLSALAIIAAILGFGLNGAGESFWIKAIIWIALLSSGFAMICAIRALIPRRGIMVDYEPEEIYQDLLSRVDTPTHQLSLMSNQISALKEVLSKKYSWLVKGFWLLKFAVGFTFLAFMLQD